MARFTKLLGSARGRVGGLVFSKGENGDNYVRSYQPQVFNPKTDGQKGQRAKMNLVGRMSQVTPALALAGMAGVNGRARRSRFTSILLKATTIDTSDPSALIAKIEPADVVFSEGAGVISASVSTPLAVTSRSVSIGLTLADASLAGMYGEKVIVTIIDPSQKGGYSQIVASDVVFENTTARTVSFALAADIADGSLVSIYRAPFVLSDNGRQAIDTSTLYTDGSDMLAKLVSVSSNVRQWGKSLMSASQVFTQA